MLNLNYVKPDWIMLNQNDVKPDLHEVWLNDVKPACDSRIFFFREKGVGCISRQSDNIASNVSVIYDNL